MEEKPVTDAAIPQPWHLLEKRQPFSQSLLWELQRRYFLTRSILAWQQEEVPQYVTTNPTVANCYAQIVFAFFRDRESLERAGRRDSEPMHICELGAGSGRFAFHFLNRLSQLCDQHGVSLTRFRYVLTDLVPDNLDFFRGHPHFSRYFEMGVLDTALFDVVSSDALVLQGSGATLGAGALGRPLVVLANYLFDSVPQDFYHVHDGQCDRALVSLAVDADPATLTAPELLARVEYQLEYETLQTPVYDEPALQGILTAYQGTLTDAFISFPVAGLRCLHTLKALSTSGLVLLSADKGYHHVSADESGKQPGLVRHGSFSLDVNYDAIKQYCELGQGVALLPAFRHQSLAVSAFLMVSQADAHVETQRAYRRHVEEFGPDDFFTLSKYLRKNLAEMSIEELLACLRLTHHDSTQFARYLPRLMQLAPKLTEPEKAATLDAIQKVWAGYFPLGESADLAFDIARLCYDMDEYRQALAFFERSSGIYGEHTGTLYNMAACHQLLGEATQAEALVRRLQRQSYSSTASSD
jgi:hypothetical protein